MRKQIVLISCASQKLSSTAKAKDLYISTLFKLNRKYAEQLKPNAIYVLSAKYGLLQMEQEVETYELTLNNMKSSEIRAWAAQVLTQLKLVCSIEDSNIIFLAGDKYRKFLIPHLKHFEIPLEGLPIGKQLKKLKSLTNER